MAKSWAILPNYRLVQSPFLHPGVRTLIQYTEIRLIIYRLLFRRDAIISPCSVHQWDPMHMGVRTSLFKDVMDYRYEWDAVHQLGFGHEPVNLKSNQEDHPAIDLTVSIVTEPTRAQASLIADGERSLPFTFVKEDYVQIGCNVIQRGDIGQQVFQVLNRMKLRVRPMYGISMLRVCKQISAECSTVLYGENMFSFGSRLSSREGHDTYGIELGDFDDRVLDPFVELLGMVTGSTVISHPETEIKANINAMFLPTFSASGSSLMNPMLRWFNKIGPSNASRLARVKLSIDDSLSLDLADPGFGALFIALSAVLRHSCPELKNLTLCMKWMNLENISLTDNELLDVQEYIDRHSTAINEAVGKVVGTLQTLQVLQLDMIQSSVSQKTRVSSPDTNPVFNAGTWITAPSPATTPWPDVLVDEWGTAVKWIEFVRNRAAKQAKEAYRKRMASVSREVGEKGAAEF